jgi:hypothetical protein
VSVVKDAWSSLRAVSGVVERLTDLSDEVRLLRAENRDLRDRVVRIETIIDEARRQSAARPLPPKKR